MPATSICSASSLEPRFGAKPPSSPTPPPRPRSCSVFLSAWKTSAPMRRHSVKLGAPQRHDHELLEVDRVVGVGAAVEDVHHRHGQHVRRVAAEVAPQRQPLLGRGGVRGRQRDAEDRVGAQPRLVGRAVEVDQRAIEALLVGRVAAGDRLGDLAVDVADRLASRPCRRTRRRRRAARWPRTRRSRRPLGTAARPAAPERSTSSTSTVGLPRLSRTCRAWTLSIWLIRSTSLGRSRSACRRGSASSHSAPACAASSSAASTRAAEARARPSAARARGRRAACAPR